MQIQTSKYHWAITLMLIALLIVLPIQIRADGPTTSQPDPTKPQETWAILVCAVAVVGLAGGIIYVVNKKCAPKYYWLWDGEPGNPPTTWVGTATDKECSINGWKKISGPYDRPGDAPPTCPDLTNRVQKAMSQPIHIATQTSQDGKNWTTVDVQYVDLEDHAYFPTNTSGTMLRFQFSP